MALDSTVLIQFSLLCFKEKSQFVKQYINIIYVNKRLKYLIVKALSYSAYMQAGIQSMQANVTFAITPKIHFPISIRDIPQPDQNLWIFRIQGFIGSKSQAHYF